MTAPPTVALEALAPCPTCKGAASFCDIESNVGTLWTAECSDENCTMNYAQPWFVHQQSAVAWWNRGFPSSDQIALPIERHVATPKPVECEPSMRLDTQPGDKVVFAYPENGYPGEAAAASLALVPGRAYTIDRIQVGQSYTSVWLVEKPGAAFNSVHFANAKKDVRQSVAEGERHSDDVAVDRFAAAMKAKLAKKREQGYSGWDEPDECTVDSLARMLVEHLPKGDTVDIANFAMMLWNRLGGDRALSLRTAQPAAPSALTLSEMERAACEAGCTHIEQNADDYDNQQRGDGSRSKKWRALAAVLRDLAQRGR